MKYFKQAYDDVNYGKFDISHEMIQPQLNDPVINKIVGMIEALNFKVNDSDPIKAAPKRNEITVVTKEITRLVKERFGINVILLDNTDGQFCTYPLNFKLSNVITPELADLGDAVDATVDNKNIKDKDIEGGVYTGNDYDSLIKKWATNFKNSLRDNRLNMVSIDLDKGYISGVPDIYKSYIVMDFLELHSLGATAREVTAIFLHEMGHNFTIVENTYRQVRNTTILLENLRDVVGLKGKSPRTALKLTYEKIFNESVPANATVEQIMTDWVEREQGIMMNGINNHSFTDSEALADQFASRFGFNTEIVTGLNKLQHNRKYGSTSMEVPLATLEGLLLMFASSFTWTAVVAAIIGTASMPLIGLSSIIFSGIVASIYMGRDFETGGNLTYDTLYKRFTRVKLDAIRQIRTIPNIDNNFKNRLIEDIEEIDKYIANLKLPSTPVLAKIVRIISGKQRRAFDMKRSQQLMEELSENDLYVASSKIQQFI